MAEQHRIGQRTDERGSDQRAGGWRRPCSRRHRRRRQQADRADEHRHEVEDRRELGPTGSSSRSRGASTVRSMPVMAATRSLRRSCSIRAPLTPARLRRIETARANRQLIITPTDAASRTDDPERQPGRKDPAAKQKFRHAATSGRRGWRSAHGVNQQNNMPPVAHCRSTVAASRLITLTHGNAVAWRRHRLPARIEPPARVSAAGAVLAAAVALSACATGPRSSFDVDQPALDRAAIRRRGPRPARRHRPAAVHRGLCDPHPPRGSQLHGHGSSSRRESPLDHRERHPIPRRHRRRRHVQPHDRPVRGRDQRRQGQ